jgi:DNA-binding transcriptional ArsR family regulator/GTPase SAR1 family protein
VSPINRKRLKEGINKALEQGPDARPRSPLARWRLSDNPFQHDLVDQSALFDAIFVDSQEFYLFAEWATSFLSEKEIHENKVKTVLLVAPDGIGKTTFAKKLIHELKVLKNELGKAINAKYLHVSNQSDSLEEKPQDDELLITNIGFEGAISRQYLTDIQLLFLDDADTLCGDISAVLSALSQNIDDEKDFVVVLIISPSTYSFLEIKNPTILDFDTHNIRSLDKNEIITLLQKRIEYFQESGRPHPFTDLALERIAYYSIGLPTLALNLAARCLIIETDVIKENHVEAKAIEGHFDIVKRIADRDEEYWEGSRGEILKKLAISLSPIEQQKLKESRSTTSTSSIQKRLRGLEGTSSAELVERVSLSSQGTTSHHLKNLNEGGVVKQIKIGRNRLYTIEPPIRNAVELALMRSTPIKDVI